MVNLGSFVWYHPGFHGQWNSFCVLSRLLPRGLFPLSWNSISFSRKWLVKIGFLLILDIYFLEDNCSYTSRTQVARRTVLIRFWKWLNGGKNIWKLRLWRRSFSDRPIFWSRRCQTFCHLANVFAKFHVMKFYLCFVPRWAASLTPQHWWLSPSTPRPAFVPDGSIHRIQLVGKRP